MSDEASNIVRRFIKIADQLEPLSLGFLRQSCRSLDPGDLRRLADEIVDVASRRPISERPVYVIRAGDPPRPQRHSHVGALRGLARSIIRYGGPEAVRRDADPVLVEALNRLGWQ